MASSATEPIDVHGGEEESESLLTTSTCTQVCGNEIGSYSCAKICLVNVYPEGHYEKRLRAYVILDDQSNKSLARFSFIDIFGITKDALVYTQELCCCF